MTNQFEKELNDGRTARINRCVLCYMQKSGINRWAGGNYKPVPMGLPLEYFEFLNSEGDQDTTQIDILHGVTSLERSVFIFKFAGEEVRRYPIHPVEMREESAACQSQECLQRWRVYPRTLTGIYPVGDAGKYGLSVVVPIADQVQVYHSHDPFRDTDDMQTVSEGIKVMGGHAVSGLASTSAVAVLPIDALKDIQIVGEAHTSTGDVHLYGRGSDTVVESVVRVVIDHTSKKISATLLGDRAPGKISMVSQVLSAWKQKGYTL